MKLRQIRRRTARSTVSTNERRRRASERFFEGTRWRREVEKTLRRMERPPLVLNRILTRFEDVVFVQPHTNIVAMERAHDVIEQDGTRVWVP